MFMFTLSLVATVLLVLISHAHAIGTGNRKSWLQVRRLQKRLPSATSERNCALFLRGGGEFDLPKVDITSESTGYIDESKVIPSKERRSWFRFDFIYPIVLKGLSNFIADADVLRVCSRIMATVAWLYVILSALGTIGVDTKPVLSLLGIGGLTVGFSAHDLLADSYAGFLLLFLKPFQRGDVITVNGLKGKVISIDMRYVKLYSVEEKSEILLPVSTVYKSEIKISRS